MDGDEVDIRFWRSTRADPTHDEDGPVGDVVAHGLMTRAHFERMPEVLQAMIEMHGENQPND